MIPLKDVSAATCCSAFLRGWLARYGLPDTIITDRGAQFTSTLWKDLMSRLGIHSSTTTAYHPQANGLVERMHRQLKGSLRASLDDNAWMEALPLVLLGMRSAWREGPDTTPSEMVYGTCLRLPGQFIPNAEPADNSLLPPDAFLRSFFSKMRSLKPVVSAHHSAVGSTPHLPPSLLLAKHVYVRHDAVRRPLQRPYDGPYEVISSGPKSFVIRRNGEPYTVSVDRLKAAWTPPDRLLPGPTATSLPVSSSGAASPLSLIHI